MLITLIHYDDSFYLTHADFPVSKPNNFETCALRGMRAAGPDIKTMPKGHPPTRLEVLKISSKKIHAAWRWSKELLKFFSSTHGIYCQKSMKNKGKTLVFDHFPLFFIDFDGNPSKI